MIDHGIVESTVRPDSIRPDECSVWVSSYIASMERDETQLYRYQLKQYGKDEYLLLLEEQNQALEQQLTDTQLALCELYEGMVI